MLSESSQGSNLVGGICPQACHNGMQQNSILDYWNQTFLFTNKMLMLKHEK